MPKRWRKQPDRLKHFKAFCRNNDYDLLHDDYKFIEHILKDTQTLDAKKILDGYLAAWVKGMQTAQISYQKQNKGRHKANLWLLNYFPEKTGC